MVSSTETDVEYAENETGQIKKSIKPDLSNFPFPNHRLEIIEAYHNSEITLDTRNLLMNLHDSYHSYKDALVTAIKAELHTWEETYDKAEKSNNATIMIFASTIQNVLRDILGMPQIDWVKGERPVKEASL